MKRNNIFMRQEIIIMKLFMGERVLPFHYLVFIKT